MEHGRASGRTDARGVIRGRHEQAQPGAEEGARPTSEGQAQGVTMANNRLYLKCDACGDEIPIARFSAGANHWCAARVYPEDSPELDRWFFKHSRHEEDPGTLAVSLTGEGAWGLTLKG